jgi:hypothetical protein
MPSDVLGDVPEVTGTDSVEDSMAMVVVDSEVTMAEVTTGLLLEVSTLLWTSEVVVEEMTGGITSVVVLTEDAEVVVITSGGEEEGEEVGSVVDSVVTTSEVGGKLSTWVVTVVVMTVVTNSETTLTLEFSTGSVEASLSLASCRLCRCSSMGRCSWASVLCSAG